MKKLLVLMLTALMMLTGCNSATTEGETENNESNTLTVYSPLPLEFIDSLVADFEEDTQIKVEVLAMGTGDALKRIESEAANPLADVLWSGTVSTVKNKSEFFADYQTVNEDMIIEEFKNTEGNMTRFDIIPSVIMVNTDLVGDIKIEGYQDLLNPELKGKIAMADPSASSSAFEHLVNMLYDMGEGDPEKGWEYVGQFIDNLDGKLLSGSSAVYKGVADGEYVVGLTFEEGGMNYVTAGAPVDVRYMEEGVIFKGDGIYIIKDAKNMTNAQKFLDYMTSQKAQKKMNDSLNRRTVRTDLEASPILKPIEEIKIVEDNEDYTAAHKAEWLEKFKDLYISAQ